MELPEGLDELGMEVLETIAQQAEPILKRKLEGFGVTSPQELPSALSKEIFISAFREGAKIAFPDINPDKLTSALKAFSDDNFRQSHKLMSSIEEPKDAFEPARGRSAAIVMAGFGLPVAPFDVSTGELLAPYSTDLETIRTAFGETDEYIVCYNSAEAEFYSLQTDCTKTLASKIKYNKAARPIRALFKRAHLEIPKADDKFVHYSLLFARKNGDQIPTLGLIEDAPDKGSIMLCAGWLNESGEIEGAPPKGRAAVPAGLVHKAARDPQFAYWLTEPHDKEPFTVH